MEDRYYLLSVRELCREGADGLFADGLRRIDGERRAKAGRMRAGKARAANVGAGLLLQLAVRDALRETGQSLLKLREYTISEILQILPAPLQLRLDYGERGKPYLRDYPFYFNLSHSGEYVFCAVSSREVGADIQYCVVREREAGADIGQCPAAEGENLTRIAERFFSRKEREALKALEQPQERTDLFYRLWVRKEAYGKLTGMGVGSAIGENFLPGMDSEREEMLWYERRYPKGYRIAVCRRGSGTSDKETP